MNQKQQEIAQQDMVEWLADPQELGKKPSKIECAGDFELYEMHYYIFKFKTGLLSQWLVGVSGGYEGDGLEPCGHTFSDMKKYNAATAKDDCIAMIERLRAYWMEQAKNLSDNNKNFPFEEMSDTACIVCKHIVNGERPILFVSHDEDDGMWQFLCGESHGTDDAKVVALEEVFARDSSIGELCKMPCGYQATRDRADSAWVIRKQ